MDGKGHRKAKQYAAYNEVTSCSVAVMHTVHPTPEGQMRFPLVHLDLEIGDASALPKAIIGSPNQVSSPVHNHRGGRVNNAPARGHEIVAIVALLVPLEEIETWCSELV